MVYRWIQLSKDRGIVGEEQIVVSQFWNLGKNELLMMNFEYIVTKRNIIYLKSKKLRESLFIITESKYIYSLSGVAKTNQRVTVLAKLT